MLFPSVGTLYSAVFAHLRRLRGVAVAAATSGGDYAVGAVVLLTAGQAKAASNLSRPRAWKKTRQMRQ